MLKSRKTTVTPKKDALNRDFIERTASAPFPIFIRGLTPDWRWQLEHGTPEDRAAYVKKLQGRVYIAFSVLVVIVAAMSDFGRDQVAPKAIETPAGQILSIQLHETALSTSTTIETTSGTYQVHGGVTGAIGNQAILTLIKAPRGDQSSVCVESEIKAACYRLL